MDLSKLKEEAAKKAVSGLKNGMSVGLGTGSTAYFVVEEIGRKIRDGFLKDIVGMPTSERTADQARKLGIPLVGFDTHPALDVAIDGADEVGPELGLVKGLGGALLREKIVAAAARRFIVVVDETKIVKKLGTKAPLPVEVTAFGWEALQAKIERLGGRPVLRRDKNGDPFLTDGKNYILDCRWPDGIDDPEKIHRELKQTVGVVETGLFIGMASVVIVAESGGIRTIQK